MTDDGKIPRREETYAGLDRVRSRAKPFRGGSRRAGAPRRKVTVNNLSVGLYASAATLVVEPRAMMQWFCKMKDLAEKQQRRVRESGEIHHAAGEPSHQLTMIGGD